MENKGFFQFDITLNVLVSFSALFEYLCYGISLRGPSLYFRFKRQIQTSDLDV